MSSKEELASPLSPQNNSEATKDEGSEAAGYKAQQDIQEAGADQEDDGEDDMTNSASAVLASQPGSGSDWRPSISASREDADAHYYSCRTSLQTLNYSSASEKMTGMSDPVREASEGDPGSCSGDSEASTVVVARAECKLAHPRPSQSSEKRLLQVLVKEEKEGDGGEQSEEQSEERRRRTSDGSQASTSKNFRTARQGSPST